jgi:hypothetical protein
VAVGGHPDLRAIGRDPGQQAVPDDVGADLDLSQRNDGDGATPTMHAPLRADLQRGAIGRTT